MKVIYGTARTGVKLFLREVLLSDSDILLGEAVSLIVT